jgi:chromosome segregation ATPase
MTRPAPDLVERAEDLAKEFEAVRRPLKDIPAVLESLSRTQVNLSQTMDDASGTLAVLKADGAKAKLLVERDVQAAVDRANGAAELVRRRLEAADEELAALRQRLTAAEAKGVEQETQLKAQNLAVGGLRRAVNQLRVGAALLTLVAGAVVWILAKGM